MEMRPFCLLVVLGLLASCTSLPKVSTFSDFLPPSKGIRPLGFLDTSSLADRGLRGPSGIAVDNSGNLYVADTNNDRILKFNSGGMLLKQQGGFGWDAGQFNRPVGLYVDRGLNLYVADSQNKRVQLFDLDLNFVAAIQPAETLDFRGLGTTQDLAVSSAGELYISDTWNDWVVQIDNLHNFKIKIGGFEAGEGKLIDPLGLAVDPRGDLYLADSGNKRVVRYDPFGNFVKAIGAGVLSKPADVLIAGPEILVCDLELSQILAFDRQGNLLWKQGSPGDEPGQFREPAGLAAFQGRLYVAERGNSRIQIFEIIR